MIRNPQILGSRATWRRDTVRVTLCAKLAATLVLVPALCACGLKGPLYMPAPASAGAAPAAAAPADTTTPAAMPSTPNTSAR